jgi:hypothetical protein
MTPASRPLPDLLRSVGGVLVAVGAVVLLTRKSSSHGWSSFAQLLVVLVPTAALYALCLGDGARRLARRAEPAQAVLAVTAILLWPLVLLEFLHWAGASTSHSLNVAAVFAITAVLAVFAALRADAPYAILLAGLSLIVAWLLVWGKILDHPSANAYRWLLLAGGAVLVLAAGVLSQAPALGAGELATAGALALVAAGVFGVVVGGFLGAFHAVASAAEAGGQRIPHANALARISGAQRTGWDVYLLLCSLALIWIGSRARVRGLGYVGGAGVLAFLISVGAQITRLEAGHPRSSDLAGWPLVLLVIGAVALLVSLLRRRPE